MKFVPFLTCFMLVGLSLWLGTRTSLASAPNPQEKLLAVMLHEKGSATPFSGDEDAVTPQPTKTPKPTPTPIVVPPPSKPGTVQMLVIFGILPGVIVLIGLGLNRRRIF